MVSRSAGGFLFVPLCSLIADGAIEELWRLHVWLPDGKRGNEFFGVHGHTAFGQSWILAGESTNRRWEVTDATDPESATYAEYAVAWNGGDGDGGESGRNSGSNSAYKTHQVSSTAVNTGRLRTATLLREEHERRGMTYALAASEWHSTEVTPDRVCATLFLFDGWRETFVGSGILGPRDGTSSTTLRDPAGLTPRDLASAVELLRGWEDAVESAGSQKEAGDIGRARECFGLAATICSDPAFPNGELYSRITRTESELASS